jgi:hypothetical protein
MSDYTYYAEKRYDYGHVGCTGLWKVNKKMALGASEDTRDKIWMSAEIALNGDFTDAIPKSTDYQKYQRISMEAFNKYFNKCFDALQKLQFHDGECYIDRDEAGNDITFHAFYRNPSRHYKISFTQHFEYAAVGITTERTISYRRGVANRCRLLSEKVFSQAFKLVLEFFFDGSAIPINHEKLWKSLDLLGGTAEPDQPVLINDEYYYLRARELMLKRKEEIKLRLLELDDIPSKRRELRAEMKGIDYCVSILDKNH